jgi:integrase
MAQSYLVLNQSGYYFRIVVPVDLRSMIGMREIKRSLKTGVLGLAKEKARLLAGKIQRLYRALREDRMSQLDQKKIQELVHAHVKETLEWIENEPLTRDKPISLEEAHAHADIISGMAQELHKSLVKGDFKQVSHIADRLLKDENLEDTDKESIPYKRLCRELLKSAIELSKVDVARTLGDYDMQYPTSEGQGVSPSVASAETIQPKESSVTLEELINTYMQENIKAQAWAQATINDYNTISKVMQRFIGEDTPVHKINHVVMRDYKEVLQCLPPRFITLKKYEGMTADDVKALELPPDETISVKSINKNLTFVTSLFNYAVTNGYMDMNPAQGMKIREKAIAKDSVAPFDTNDLNLIFKNTLGYKHPYQYWIPLLGLYTGARREELCQLHVDDLKVDNGIWYLDINADTPDKTLKNQSSKRLIPLHQFVIEMGFPQYVKTLEQTGRIFPELTKSKAGKKYGHYVGKWFNGILGKMDIKPDSDGPQKTFHSFRHGLITTLTQAGADGLMLKQVMGHSEKGVTFSNYFKGFTVEQLYDGVICKIDHGIDLEHLKDSKWTE